MAGELYDSGSDPIPAQLTAIEHRLDGVRDDYAKEARKRDIRIRTNRLLTFIVAILAVVAIGIGWSGIRERHAVSANTTSARRASCVQSNLKDRNEIKSDDKRDEVLASILSPLPRTPEHQVQVESALTKLHNASVVGHPLRDCSKAGIEAYLKLAPRS